MTNYTYKDARYGTDYVSHTCTDADDEERMSGATQRDVIKDGGDVTTCSKSVLPIGPLGSSRLGNG
jgi:hypothetical protein